MTGDRVMPGRQANGNTESVDNYLKAIFYLGGPEESRVTIECRACIGHKHVAEVGCCAGSAG
jgi:hypothetical protein